MVLSIWWVHRVTWRVRCGAWPLILISLSVPLSAMTKPCAYGTCPPATVCWLYASSRKVSHLTLKIEKSMLHSFTSFLSFCGAFVQLLGALVLTDVLHRGALLLLLPWGQGPGGGPERRKLPHRQRRHPGGPSVFPPPQGHHLRHTLLTRSDVALHPSLIPTNSLHIFFPAERKTKCKKWLCLKKKEKKYMRYGQVFIFSPCCEEKRYCCRLDPNTLMYVTRPGRERHSLSEWEESRGGG